MTFAILLFSVVAGSGCGTTGLREYVHNGLKVGPNYGRPPAPMAPAWIEAGHPSVRNTPLSCGEWWSVFGDPTLSAMIEEAYGQNPTLRVVGARVLEARAGRAIAVGNFLPQSQTAIATYNRIQLSSNSRINLGSNTSSSNGGGGSTGGTTGPSDGSTGGTGGTTGRSNGSNNLAYSNWFDGFNLNWELDLWGRIRRNIESSNASLDASVEDYDAALVTLFADIATNYVQYRVAQQRIKIARSNVEIQQGILALAEERFRVGTTTRLDVEQAKTILEQTRSSIPALQIQLGQANDTLCILLGFPPRDLEPDLGPGPDLSQPPMPNTPTWVAAGIPADLVRRRPDVRGTERQVAAQCAQIGVAEADLYPTLFINGTIGWDAENFSKVFSMRSFQGLLLPAFRWNILNYGRIQNNIHLQQAKTEELIAAYQSQVLVAGREVQVSLRGFLRSQEQAESLRRAVEAAAEASRLGLAQYRTGTVDFNRVFNLETVQALEQDRLASSEGEIALNLISVYRSLGGGWEYRLPKTAPPAAPELPMTTAVAPGSTAPPWAVSVPGDLEDPRRASPFSGRPGTRSGDALPPALP